MRYSFLRSFRRKEISSSRAILSCPVRRHMYFPSTLREANRMRLKRRFNGNSRPRRTVRPNRAAINPIEGLQGQRRGGNETESEISGSSFLFRFPNIVPSKFFPRGIINLFYNIGKDLIRLWYVTDGQPYELLKDWINKIGDHWFKLGLRWQFNWVFGHVRWVGWGFEVR